MTVNTENKNPFKNALEQVCGFDLRSLALFRIGLALVIIADLSMRAKDIKIFYSDEGILPRTALIEQILNPGYWSLNLINGTTLVQSLLFLAAISFALLLLVGYHTRFAAIATWAMIISIHNRNPALIFAGDDVLRALSFWAMFLPLGAYYSLDNALNSSDKPLPKRIVSAATVALMVQQILIYAGSAAFKTKSNIWFPDGDAVYYALHFDQYATIFGGILLQFPWLHKPLTLIALWFEWLAPFMIFIPFKPHIWRTVAVISFISLHIGFGLTFELGIFPYLSISSWLAFIPTYIWDYLEKRTQTTARQGLTIYYDADCGFCKKVVHLLRTFLILPGTPILKAQENDLIYADMQRYNSWVVVDYQQNHHYKWEALSYVVSLSPILGFLAWIMTRGTINQLGTQFYETIAHNRRLAGKFTAPLQFKPLKIESNLSFNLITSLLLLYTLIWNLKSFVAQTYIRRPVDKKDWISSTHQLFNKKTVQELDKFSLLTRLDQSWSIFAPAPPRDDGWHVIVGTLEDGSQVDLLYGQSGNINWDKPTRQQRNRLYRNMQWRTYFINLNRAMGQTLYPHYAAYLCREWNRRHSGHKALKTVNIYFMDERTVPPGEEQKIEKKLHWQQSCD